LTLTSTKNSSSHGDQRGQRDQDALAEQELRQQDEEREEHDDEDVALGAHL
jgi:hypothetical protein